MLEYLNFFIGTFLTGLVLGVLGTFLPLNRTYDTERRDSIISLIDKSVSYFHNHYSPSNKQYAITRATLDYQLQSLVGETLLIPVIGKTEFDEIYTPMLSNFYLLSLPVPNSLSKTELDEHIKAINETAVKLKKIANHKRGSYRLFSRK